MVEIIGTNNTTLKLSLIDSDYIDIEFRASGNHNQIRSYLYTDGPILASYFRSLIADPKGWDGTKEWQSVEGDVIFRASNNGLGHTTIKTTLLSNVGEDDQSKYEGNVVVDFQVLKEASESLTRMLGAP